MEDRFNVGIGDGNCEDYCHADPWRGRECVEKRLVRVGTNSLNQIALSKYLLTYDVVPKEAETTVKATC